jgi:hypothetical protein
MTIGADAVAWAFAEYERNRIPRGSLAELGTTLWERVRDGAFEADMPLRKGGEEGVALYTSLKTRTEVGRSLQTDAKRIYLGDYRAHTRHVPGWLLLFPSPLDLNAVSVLCDVWPQTDLTTPGLVLAPRIQLVQALHFGDVFLLEPTPGRTPFRDAADQHKTLVPMLTAFGKWHLDTFRKYGSLPKPASRARFAEIVAAELPKMQAIIGSRAVVTRVPFPRNVIDDFATK